MKFKFILLFLIAFCQNQTMALPVGYKVSGIVLDSLSESPMENASIQLHIENKLVKSALSLEDGSFNFSIDKVGLYSLTISYIGYKVQIIPIKIEAENLAQIIVKLEIEGVDLKEISVKANKPLVSQKKGEVTYQIEGGIWQNSGNALSIINRIPVLKGRSGSAYLLYGTKVVFLLDGKPVESVGVSLDLALANLSTSEIEKIEILQSPPPSLARFGSPIVNIKTLKQKENGNLYNLNHAVGKGLSNRFGNGIKYAMKQNNLLLGLSISQSQVNQLSKINSTKIAPKLILTDSERLLSKTNLYDFKFNSEFGTNKSGIFMLILNHKNIFEPNNATTLGHYQIGNIVDSLIIFSNAQVKTNQNVASLDYGKTFSSIINLKTSFEIGQFNIKNAENIHLKRLENIQKFTNPWERGISFNSFYLENESKFGNWKIIEGVNLKNSLSTTNFLKNVGNLATINNIFKYQEHNFSTFLNTNYSKAKSDLSININLEKTNIDGFSDSDSKKIDFYSLLPSFTYNYQINDGKSLTLVYARGLKRPGYEWLNQQELYKNPYTKDIGGGVLAPTIFNKFSISSSFENGLTLTGIYSNQKNRYSFFPFLKDNNVKYTAINIKNYYYLYYSASFQKYFSKIWYFSTDVSGYYSNIKSLDYGIRTSGYTQQFSISNYLTFKKLGQFGLTSSYNTTDYSDSFQFLPQFSLNLEYSKSIFKKQGTLNVSLSDLTNSLNDRFRYKLSNFLVQDNYKYETRLLKISINYSLGNKSVKTSQGNSKTESEHERLK